MYELYLIEKTFKNICAEVKSLKKYIRRSREVSILIPYPSTPKSYFHPHNCSRLNSLYVTLKYSITSCSDISFNFCDLNKPCNT